METPPAPSGPAAENGVERGGRQACWRTRLRTSVSSIPNACS